MSTYALMVLAVILPGLALILGIALAGLGIVTLVQAYREWSDWADYAVGLTALGFGIAVEFTSIDGLVKLAVLAVIIDTAIAIVDEIM